MNIDFVTPISFFLKMSSENLYSNGNLLHYIELINKEV